MGTLAFGLGLLAVVALIVRSLLRGRKRGKPPCGGSCAGCALCREQK